jgi:hypothetical protein
MNREELAHFIVANRETKERIEARRVYIRRLAEKAKNNGIEFYRSEMQFPLP